MSAFLVSKRHIDVLVAAQKLLPDYGRPEHEKSDDELGRMLWRENMASMAYRYAKHGEMIDEAALGSYRFDPTAARGLSVIALVKACHCYAYQACEHEGWERSPAKRYCDALVCALIHEIPGYRDAPWGID